jgi:hypothetical protein
MLINAYCTHRDPPAPAFPHVLRARRDRTDPDLGDHLRGFMGFVMDRGNRPMNQTRYAVLRHVERVRHHLAFEIDERFTRELAAWARDANAILFFTDATVRTPDGEVLVDPKTGEAAPGAHPPYPADAEARKRSSEAVLAALGVQVPPSLPPVVSEVEVELRDPFEVAARATALFACALRGESLASGNPLDPRDILARLPRALEAMSPKEDAFFAAEVPSQQEIVDQTWRYEALAVLVWSLGVLDDLPVPVEICNVSALAKTMLALDQTRFATGASLRPTAAILGALDLHFRMHWATTDARIADERPPAGLEAGVVQERHYALNWLTRFEEADWDDVDTPT